MPIPAAVLAPKHAEPFVAAARAGAQGTLILDGEATHRPSRNIVARLERGPRWLAISTPRSGWFQCVAERGTGTAAFLEIADWVRERFPDHSVFLMNTGGHEYFFAGSHRVLHEAPPPENTDVWMHIGATLAARNAVERNGEVLVVVHGAPVPGGQGAEDDGGGGDVDLENGQHVAGLHPIRGQLGVGGGHQASLR